jgi:hypothetical protein
MVAGVGVRLGSVVIGGLFYLAALAFSGTHRADGSVGVGVLATSGRCGRRGGDAQVVGTPAGDGRSLLPREHQAGGVELAVAVGIRRVGRAALVRGDAHLASA